MTPTPLCPPTPHRTDPGNGGEGRQLLCGSAEHAADRAVEKVFAILGVDIYKPEAVEEFREDLRFGRSMRKTARHGILAFVAVLFASVAAALWFVLSEPFR